MEVEKKMCDALNELFAEELKEADARGRREGHRTGVIEGHRNGIVEGRADGIKLTKKSISTFCSGRIYGIYSRKM